MTARRFAIGRRTMLATAASAVLPAPAVHAQGSASGVALVIGNSRYKWEASLPNAKRDTADVAASFQALRLKTELLQDAGLAAMRAAIERFVAAARGANIAMFYFAGHGAASGSWGSQSFLVPEDADLSNPAALQTLVDVATVHQPMKEAGHSLLLFDACRNNPSDGWRQGAAVRGAIFRSDQARDFAPNMVMLSSTAPGRIALDGPAGQNSPFCRAFHV